MSKIVENKNITVEEDWTFKNLSVCDLTYVMTEEIARNIKSIKNCALVCLPLNAPDEVKSILSGVKMKNIAKIMWIDMNDREDIKIVAGDETLRQKHLWRYKRIIVAGNIIIPSDNLPYNFETAPVKLCITGTALISKDLMDSGQVEIEELNGNVSNRIKFDDIRHVPTNIVDKDFIDSLVPNTVIEFNYARGGVKKVRITKDVTLSMLREKNIHFHINTVLFGEYKWKCSKEIQSYIRAHIV